MRPLFIAVAALALSACGDVSQMKDAVGDVAKGAAEAAGALVDTKTACTLAGQSEAFCGCLQTEIGAEIKPEHIYALTQVLRDAIGGDVAKTAETATTIDPKTREAIGKCAVQGALGAAKDKEGQ